MIPAIAIAALLIVVRIWIGLTVPVGTHSHFIDGYAAFAHLFIGGLIFAAWQDHRHVSLVYAMHRRLVWLWLIRLNWKWRLFWLLSTVEVSVAVLSLM